MTFIAVLSRLS